MAAWERRQQARRVVEWVGQRQGRGGGGVGQKLRVDFTDLIVWQLAKGRAKERGRAGRPKERERERNIERKQERGRERKQGRYREEDREGEEEDN